MKRNMLSTAAVVATAATTGALVLAPTTGTAADDVGNPTAKAARHVVVIDGLDNPRQLTALPSGKLLVAEAGHGGDGPTDCVGEGEEAQCFGATGRVRLVTPGQSSRTLMHGLLSSAGPDGTFGVGSDGAARLGDTVWSIVTWGPPDLIPDGLPGDQAGMLMRSKVGGTPRAVADVSAYEMAHDTDGEGVESNPYSMLALSRNKVLVADAAADHIVKVNRKGKVRLWAQMKEYGPSVDAVPTVLTRGADGDIYVGELHSELPGKARVWRYDRSGKVKRSWKGFTTVTGVTRAKDGTLYVSELFGGGCGFDQIPTCFPGRVTRVKPNGKRRSMPVPFPAGVATVGRKVYVNAFSVSPSGGFGGNPEWSGQVWRIFK